MDTYVTRPPAEPSTTDQAKDKAQEAAGQAKEKAGTQLRSQVDQRSTRAGRARRRHRLRRAQRRRSSCASRARTSRRSWPTRPPTAPSGSASYLSESDADRILGDIEDFGRRQPWVVIGGGIALGLVASRFLKASSSRRYEQRSSGQLPARTSYDAPGIVTGPVERPVRPATRRRDLGAEPWPMP